MPITQEDLDEVKELASEAFALCMNKKPTKAAEILGKIQTKIRLLKAEL